MIRHPFSLVVYSDKLFVTDWRLDAIIEMDKITGGNERIVEKVEESNRLYGIRIYSKVNKTGFKQVLGLKLAPLEISYGKFEKMNNIRIPNPFENRTF